MLLLLIFFIIIIFVLYPFMILSRITEIIDVNKTSSVNIVK